MKFEITLLRNSTVWQLYRMRDRVQLDPEYQRLGDIWTPDKRQLLIDTILNGFDVPKLYFHKFPTPLKKDGKIYEYAIVDGKQRLETIWNFIDGKIALPDDFEFFQQPKIQASGMTYNELGQNFPELKADFDGFSLSVMCIETDEMEMIEEMFSRLNEAVPLTAAEKRNAFGGAMPPAIRKLAKEKFFVQSVPFPNKRYRHFDLATKFLLTEQDGEIVDTKKIYLDEFVMQFAKDPHLSVSRLLKSAADTLDRMSGVFAENDPLLRQVGMVMLYYHLFRFARENKWGVSRITRKQLLDFNKARESNRVAAEAGGRKVNFDLIEFERYAQSPNDSYALKFRLRVLLEQAFDTKRKIENL